MLCRLRSSASGGLLYWPLEHCWEDVQGAVRGPLVCPLIKHIYIYIYIQKNKVIMINTMMYMCNISYDMSIIYR